MDRLLPSEKVLRKWLDRTGVEIHEGLALSPFIIRPSFKVLLSGNEVSEARIEIDHIPEEPEARQAILAELGKQLTEAAVCNGQVPVAALLATEAWMADLRNSQDMHTRPSLRPDRMEVLVISVLRYDHYSFGSIYEIRRKANREVRLVPLQFGEKNPVDWSSPLLESFFNGVVSIIDS